METAKQSGQLQMTRRVVVNKVFDGSKWDNTTRAWVKKDGFKQVFFGSMIGVFKHQITDELFNKNKLEIGVELEMTYTLREYTDSKFNDYRCSINDILELKPIS